MGATKAKGIDFLVLGCQVRERRLDNLKKGTWKTKNTEETVKGFLLNDKRKEF